MLPRTRPSQSPFLCSIRREQARASSGDAKCSVFLFFGSKVTTLGAISKLFCSPHKWLVILFEAVGTNTNVAAAAVLESILVVEVVVEILMFLPAWKSKYCLLPSFRQTGCAVARATPPTKKECAVGENSTRLGCGVVSSWKNSQSFRRCFYDSN
jgi:hypothetical protein